MPKIAGGPVGSMKKLRKTMQKQGGVGDSKLRWIPRNGSMQVRFLTEPEGWYGFHEHWDASARTFFPCVEDDCPGCDQQMPRSFRYLANVVDLDKDRVIALKLAKDLATRVMIKYDKYDTIMDRDYELISSAGEEVTDVTYDADPEAPSKRNLKKYELLDLGEVLEEAWDAAFGEDGAKPSKGKKGASKAKPESKAKRSKPKPSFLEDDDDDEDEEEWEDDEDEDDEEEWEDDDEDEDDAEAEYWDRDDLESKSLGELKSLAKEWGVPTTGLKKKQIVDALMDQNDEDDDDE